MSIGRIIVSLIGMKACPLRSRRDVPWTNNTTEQVIGRMKLRSRTVRGYKNKSGLLNGLLVAGSGAC